MEDIIPGSRWMYGRRELLSSYYLIAAERLAEEAYLRGDYRRCVLVCLQSLNADPTDDNIVSWLLRAYAQLGHFGELEHAYRSYLREARVDPAGEDEHDIVIATYKELIRARAVNE
jgi:DNA-binding SARP family transcriptional activator